ncbi:unnamed protein product [Spirodela intermedia]|uniref:Uncharacterized protein n=1 Tax=Spirodela intermedia TaxID=51605 RepID=A0A7I8LN58_SPIIN|nr:unnamed protein product [Spirodela intermedia]
MRFPNIMLRLARISRRRSEAATFEVTERKATTRVGESESKKGFLTSLSHSKPCMRLSSRKAPNPQVLSNHGTPYFKREKHEGKNEAAEKGQTRLSGEGTRLSRLHLSLNRSFLEREREGSEIGSQQTRFRSLFLSPPIYMCKNM